MSEQELTITAGGSRLATSVGGTLTGRGADLSLPAVAEVEEHVPIGMGRCHLRRTGDVLQGGRDTIEGFELLKRQMGSALFGAQFQQAPVPAGGHLIDWEWLARFDLPFRGRKGDLIN